MSSSGWSRWSKPEMEKACCGCVKFRTTSFVMAYINLGISIASCVKTVADFAFAAVLVVQAIKMKRTSGMFFLVMSTTSLVSSLILLALSITLLVGLHKTRRKLLMVFLIGAGIIYMYNAMEFLVGAFTYIGYSFILPVFPIALFIEMYTFFVIHSYYLQLKPSREATITNRDNS